MRKEKQSKKKKALEHKSQTADMHAAHARVLPSILSALSDDDGVSYYIDAEHPHHFDGTGDKNLFTVQGSAHVGFFDPAGRDFKTHPTAGTPLKVDYTARCQLSVDDIGLPLVSIESYVLDGLDFMEDFFKKG